MMDGDASVRPSFGAETDPDALSVVDPIEGVRFELRTPEPVSPTPAATEPFPFPVDLAARLAVGTVEVPRLADVFVRRPDGDPVGRVDGPGSRSFPADDYCLEVMGVDVKLYLLVEGDLTVEYGPDAVTVSTGAGSLVVGARSLHRRPAGTVTTTERVLDVMRAVSLLGSALKTTSPERSFPNLRGHPPLVEIGEEFHAPDGIERPDTGVRIEVPPTYDAVFAASTLAYYLGAEVVPGTEPTLVADGVEHALAGPDGYEAELERVLKGTFLLDCLVRTEGYYEVPLRERAAVEPELDLDFAALYDRPLAERLDAYLEVPYEALAPHVPTWKLTTDVYPTPEHAEMLPFVASDLGVVRCPNRPRRTTIRSEPSALQEFYRGDAGFTRSDFDGGEEIAVVQPAPADSLEQAWVGDGYPVGATKTTTAAHRRRLDRTAGDPGSASVAVVCNDPEMDDEVAVADSFGAREFVEFDVSVHHRLPTAELRAVLESDVDLLHYVGHVDDAGIQCADGALDVRSLDEVGVTAFVLNACRSREQGAALVEAGSVGGIVTLSEVDNRTALVMGRTLARLLNRGFPLAAAVTIARDRSYAGSQYVVIGDGGLELVQSHFGAPYVLTVRRLDGDRFELSLREHPTKRYGPGSFSSPNVAEDAPHFLTGGEAGPFELTADELDAAFDLEVAPVKVGGELRWTDELSADDL